MIVQNQQKIFANIIASTIIDENTIFAHRKHLRVDYVNSLYLPLNFTKH